MNSLPFALSLLLIAICSCQIGASFAKQLFPVVGATSVTMLRLLIASLILLAVARPWQIRLSRREKITIALYGMSLGLMNLSFYLAIERIPLGIAVALEFSGPLAVAFFSSTRAKDFLWAVFALMGICLIAPLTAQEHLDLFGVMFALIAGAMWALYIVFGRKAALTIPLRKAAALGMAIATMTVLPVGISTNAFSHVTWAILPTAFFVALLSSAIPYSFEMIALKRLPAQTFGILMSLEPAVAALAGLSFLDEHLLPKQWVAIFCIVAASFGTSLSIKRPAMET